MEASRWFLRLFPPLPGSRFGQLSARILGLRLSIRAGGLFQSHLSLRQHPTRGVGCDNAISPANKIILLLLRIIFLYGTSPLCHLRDDTQQKNSHTGAPLPSFLQARMPMPAFARSISCGLLCTAYRSHGRWLPARCDRGLSSQ